MELLPSVTPDKQELIDCILIIYILYLEHTSHVLHKNLYKYLFCYVQVSKTLCNLWCDNIQTKNRWVVNISPIRFTWRENYFLNKFSVKTLQDNNEICENMFIFSCFFLDILKTTWIFFKIKTLYTNWTKL